MSRLQEGHGACVVWCRPPWKLGVSPRGPRAQALRWRPASKSRAGRDSAEPLGASDFILGVLGASERSEREGLTHGRVGAVDSGVPALLVLATA